MDSTDEEMDSGSFIRASRSNKGGSMKPQFRKRRAYHYALMIASLILLMTVVTIYFYKQSQKSKLNQEYNKLNTDLKALQDNTQAKADVYDNLKTLNSQLLNQNEGIAIQIADKKNTNAVLMKELELINEQIKPLEDNQNNLLASKKQLEDSIEQKKAKINQIENTINDLHVTINALTSKLQSYDYQI